MYLPNCRGTMVVMILKRNTGTGGRLSVPVAGNIKSGARSIVILW